MTNSSSPLIPRESQNNGRFFDITLAVIFGLFICFVGVRYFTWDEDNYIVNNSRSPYIVCDYKTTLNKTYLNYTETIPIDTENADLDTLRQLSSESQAEADFYKRQREEHYAIDQCNHDIYTLQWLEDTLRSSVSRAEKCFTYIHPATSDIVFVLFKKRHPGIRAYKTTFNKQYEPDTIRNTVRFDDRRFFSYIFGEEAFCN
jgi:hypothetical protein